MNKKIIILLLFVISFSSVYAQVIAPRSDTISFDNKEADFSIYTLNGVPTADVRNSTTGELLAATVSTSEEFNVGEDKYKVFIEDIETSNPSIRVVKLPTYNKVVYTVFPVCGNGICEICESEDNCLSYPPESCYSCPQDCPYVNYTHVQDYNNKHGASYTISQAAENVDIACKVGNDIPSANCNPLCITHPYKTPDGCMHNLTETAHYSVYEESPFGEEQEDCEEDDYKCGASHGYCRDDCECHSGVCSNNHCCPVGYEWAAYPDEHLPPCDEDGRIYGDAREIWKDTNLLSSNSSKPDPICVYEKTGELVKNNTFYQCREINLLKSMAQKTPCTIHTHKRVWPECVDWFPGDVPIPYLDWKKKCVTILTFEFCLRYPSIECCDNLELNWFCLDPSALKPAISMPQIWFWGYCHTGDDSDPAGDPVSSNDIYEYYGERSSEDTPLMQQLSPYYYLREETKIIKDDVLTLGEFCSNPSLRCGKDSEYTGPNGEGAVIRFNDCPPGKTYSLYDEIEMGGKAYVEMTVGDYCGFFGNDRSMISGNQHITDKMGNPEYLSSEAEDIWEEYREHVLTLEDVSLDILTYGFAVSAERTGMALFGIMDSSEKQEFEEGLAEALGVVSEEFDGEYYEDSMDNIIAGWNEDFKDAPKFVTTYYPSRDFIEVGAGDGGDNNDMVQNMGNPPFGVGNWYGGTRVLYGQPGVPWHDGITPGGKYDVVELFYSQAFTNEYCAEIEGQALPCQGVTGSEVTRKSFRFKWMILHLVNYRRTPTTLDDVGEKYKQMGNELEEEMRRRQDEFNNMLKEASNKFWEWVRSIAKEFCGNNGVCKKAVNKFIDKFVI